MSSPSQPTPRDKLPTVVHSTGEETTAGPVSDTVTKSDFVPTKLAQYKVLRKLGQGGMGWVLLAEDTQLGRRVALKVMRGKHTSDKDSRERFIREARAAAALKHDHIITIYQADEDHGIPFLAMELLEGGTLQQRLEYPKPLSIGAAVRIAREIAEGLAVAHERGMVHRDIKPANIWLESPKGRVKILDFGLARHANASHGLTMVGEIVGTPHYMAPEQARGKAVDARTDLFSLGCILYRMTTGRLPFAGETLLATLTAIAVDMPTPVQELNPQVPDDLADLIWRLLAKDPAERPASADELIKELSAIEFDVTGGSRSGFNIPVPPAIQINVEPRPAIAPRPAPATAPSKPAAAVRTRSSSAQKHVIPWIVAAVSLGILIPLSVVGAWWFIREAGNFSERRPAPPPPTARIKVDNRGSDSLVTSSSAGSNSVAEWAFDVGGRGTIVELQVAGQKTARTAVTKEQLPSGSPFAILGVRLAGSTKLEDNDLERFANLSSLYALDLADTNITDSGIKKLTGLIALTNLRLDGTRITEESIKHLAAKCPNLKSLVIGRTRCTPAVLDSLKEFKQLEELSLAELPITDSDLERLNLCVALKELSLGQTKITGQGLAKLTGLVELSNLILDRSEVTDEGLAALAARGPLIRLCINSVPNVTDVGLEKLKAIERLDWLEIKDDSRISNRGLAQMATVRSLKHLEATKGQFAASAINDLKAALPQCEVILREPKGGSPH